MSETRTVGVKDLKNNLSAWLREVRRGARILVSDRNRVVAEIHEPGATYATGGGTDPVLASWVESGAARLPTRNKEPLPDSPVSSADGTAVRLLDEDRGGARP